MAYGTGSQDRSQRGRSPMTARDPQMFIASVKKPAEVVEGLQSLQNLGRRILGAWERRCNKYPQAVRVGETCGTPDCVLEKKWVERRRAELQKITVGVERKWTYLTPLDRNLLEERRL